MKNVKQNMNNSVIIENNDQAAVMAHNAKIGNFVGGFGTNSSNINGGRSVQN